MNIVQSLRLRRAKLQWVKCVGVRSIQDLTLALSKAFGNDESKALTVNDGAERS